MLHKSGVTDGKDGIWFILRSHVCKSILKGVASPWQLDRRIFPILKILTLPLVVGRKCAGNSSKLQEKYVSVVVSVFWARRIDFPPSLNFSTEDVPSRFDNFRQFATACQLRHLYSSADRKKLTYITHAHLLIYCQALYALSICTVGDMEINVWRNEIWRQIGPIFYWKHTNDNYRHMI